MNPFVYGEIVPAASFVDREDELDRLTRDLLAGQKVFLISPRRYGKSSLVQQALKAAARGGALIVDVTVSSYSSYVGFLEGYARALSGVERQTGTAVAWLREALAPVRPEIRIDASRSGRSGLSVSFPGARSEREVSQLAQEVFALPGRIADARGRKLAIALDEFQAIGAFNGGSVEHALRAAVQVQRSVGYVFSGSEPALMERMLGRSRPFYKAGPVMRLARIPADRFSTFIEAKFKSTGVKTATGLGQAIVELAGNLPYDVQRLAHELWDDARAEGKKSIDLEDLHATLTRLLGEHASLFEATWQRLTLAQRGALRAAVLQEGRELLSADTRSRYRLSGASTVQASLAALVREDILAREGDRHIVVDSLLREWVAEDILMPLLERLGLGRPDLRAWAMYDWANSAFQTTIIAVVFPIYYQKVVAAGQPESVSMSRFAWATTIAILIVAIVAPILGAVADYSAIKKRLLAVFLGIGASATAAMYWIQRGDWQFALVLFVIGNVGVAGTIVFYESLLPHLVGEKDLDRVSTAGYAIGYMGGGSLLAINLLMIQKPGLFGIPDAGVATRLSLASVAVWWVLFSIPLFRQVPEPPARIEVDERPGENALRTGARRLGETFKELRRYRDAFVFLLAFLLYNDGIQTMIRMATLYGTGIGLPESSMITALLMTQFIGIPCAFLFGMVASRTGARNGVFFGLAVYLLISLLGYYMSTAAHFFALAALVGMVQGGTQALSRSLFASMIPRHKSSEFFAFFSVFERYAGVLGPAIFAFVIERSGSGRAAILAVAGFFVIGAVILAFVNVDRGRQAARAAEAELRPTP